ncbi:MAG: type II secretion system protein GspL [Mariprofundaceae bacterium]|nr:type II secretion system protein GspL [Mariprofundaceae bacterium]
MMENAMPQQSVQLSWDGQSVAWKNESEVFVSHDCEQSGLMSLPELTDSSAQLDVAYLPMEWLLVRSISLPLKSPSMVDADMLFQEMADSMDIDANEWWLSWHMDICDDGVAGMVFALPESLRQSMLENPQWNQAKSVLVDGYQRLLANCDGSEACAVLDQDADGAFIGFFDGQAWRGMRRFNGEIASSDIAQIIGSWQAMGFDANQNKLCGRADAALREAMQGLCAHCDIDEWDASVSRNQGNLDMNLQALPVLNLRHGRWATGSTWDIWRVWKRSLFLCGLGLLAWMMVVWVDLYRMDHELTSYQQRIEQAFHQGLPNETVMLDAMGQLRQAAGGKRGAGDHIFLSSLQAVSQVYQATPWQLKLLALRDGRMKMSGQVKDIEALNHIQSALQKALDKDVQIVDTNITGKHVTFRMSW